MRKPRIVAFDLETSNLNADFGFILSACWKELGKPTKGVNIKNAPTFKKDCTNDKWVCQQAYEALKDADILVGHFCQYFDIPYLNSRLLYHGLDPLPKIPFVDTWRVARNGLKLHSNRLASVLEFFKLGSKTKLSGPIWVRAMSGHVPSLDYVYKHCKVDVEELEKAYLKMRPLMHTHPKLTAIVDLPKTCAKCGTPGSLIRRGTQTISGGKLKQRVQCKHCGGWDAIKI